MSVDREVYALVRESVKDKPLLDEAVFNGVAAYCDDNGLERAVSKYQDENTRSRVLRAFIAPIIQMPEDKMVVFFKTYPMRASFKLLSNRIRNEAMKKYRDNAYHCNVIDALGQQLGEMAILICRDKVLKKVLSDELADCQLELDYLSGWTESISLRMQRMV